MHSNHTHSRQRTFLFTIFSVVLLLICLPLAAQAFFSSGEVDINGYAWSETIGWISLGNGGTEQVTINTNGTVTGYAWSENIGWIKFGGLSNFPAAGGNATMVGVGGGDYEMRGWARACAGTATGDCTTMTSRTDGWDGWIALSGSNHSVRFNATGPVSNSYAWGDDVVGWVDMFSRVTYTPATPPSAVLNTSACSVPSGAATCGGRVSWTISNATNPGVYKTQPGSDTLSTAETGAENPYTMQLGTNTFEARDDATVLDTASVNISCVANASPVGGVCTCDSGYTANGGVCETAAPPTGTLDITPPIVRRGQDVTIDWTSNSTACVASNTQDSSTVSGGNTPSGTNTLTITSQSQVIVTLTCDGVVVDQETIRILPSIFES